MHTMTRDSMCMFCTINILGQVQPASRLLSFLLTLYFEF